MIFSYYHFVQGALNEPPVVSQSIPDTPVGEGATVEYALGQYFADADGTPQYTIQGTPPSWASIVGGDVLTLAPTSGDAAAQAGFDTLTVRATDSENPSEFVEDSFLVAIHPPTQGTRAWWG